MSSHPDEAGAAHRWQRVRMKPNVQLLAYRFDPGAEFEGLLVGALERIESGGALRIRDVLFVGRDPASGELLAIDVRGRQQGSLVAPLLGFRLDPAERDRATERALRAYDRGSDPNPLRVLGETLAPGGAVATVLIEHMWAHAIDDAVARTGGAALLSGFVAGTELTELSSELVAAAARRGESPQPA
jgi:hypothetical protein